MTAKRRRKTVSLSARLPEDLVERADKLAQEKGVSRSELIEKGLALIVARDAISAEELFHLATQAMLEGKPVPVKVEWHAIEKKLQESRPRFATAEEAMAAVRRRK